MTELKSPIVHNLGIQPYEKVWAEMKAFTLNRDKDAADEIWVVSHPPVFTLGQAGKMEHLLAPGDIPLVQSDRGGQVTYHGPGQPVIYPLLNLRRLKLGVRDMVTALENSVIKLLADFGIKASAKPDAPGVYVEGKKIASLGLRIKKGCSYHGLSFNLDMDLEPYSRINVCGYQGLQVTQLADLVEELPAQEQIVDQLVNYLTEQLGYTAAVEHQSGH